MTAEKKKHKREYDRKWRAKNPDKVLAKSRKWDAEHIEKRRSYARTLRAQNMSKSKAYQRNWASHHKEARRAYVLRTHYGLSLEQFEEMKHTQNFKCAICQQIRPLAVDHCHRTGKVRDLLCKKCNVGLGHVDDRIDLLDAMKRYLEKHS